MASMHKKAQATARELANRLRIRFGEVSLLVTEGVDSSGNPTIAINDGTPAAGEQNIFIRIIEHPSIGTNSIGLAADSYSPHVIQVAMESSATANVALVLEANKMRAMMELLAVQARLEVYLENNLTAPSVTSIDPTKLKVTLDNLYFPLMATT